MPRKPGDQVALGVEMVLCVTKKAILIRGEDPDVGERWIPLSVVDWEESEVDPKPGGSGTMYVEEWFARQEGLS